MANNTTTVTLRGKASFAKILGAPVLNYSKDGKEWKMDLVITKDTVKEVKGYGIGDRVKSKDDYLDGRPFLSFKQAELRKDGTPNDPIKVVDINGKPWDHTKLIGNESDVDVKFRVVDYGVGKKNGVYIAAVRILNLVPYERQEFAPVTEDDDFAGNLAQAEDLVQADAEFQKDFGLEAELDDDIEEIV